MKRTFKTLMASAALIFGFGLAPLAVPVTVNAAPAALAEACQDDPNAPICKQATQSPTAIIKIIVNILLFIVGVISVIMIIVGGIRYTTSAGNSSAVTSAKNTILFAIVGLLVSFFAYAIVNWLLNWF